MVVIYRAKEAGTLCRFVLLLVLIGLVDRGICTEERTLVDCITAEEADKNTAHDNASEHEHEHHSIHVASWKYKFVQNPLILTSFIVAISLFKILFHHLPKSISETVPESCVLIVAGILLGFLFLIDTEDDPESFLFFDSDVFFLFLLPPIILEAAFSLRDRIFNANLGTILLYAVLGTLCNISFIALGLHGLDMVGALPGLNVGLLDLLIFASLIAAVDPVAVLAIFQEVGVNKMLYFLVFGESLLNDAVTVVIYNLMISFKQMPTIAATDILLGVAAFLCVAFGAAAIGFMCGIITAFITKYTNKIRVVEPIVMFGMAYLSYLLAEMFHFSGIIAIICCGINQAQFASQNISSKSFVSVHYFVKVASSVTESLIFIILGVNVVNNWTFLMSWHTGFSVAALVLCFVVRFLVTFGLTYAVNFRTSGVRHISFQEQFIMSYGGLRGAISFSLAFMLDKTKVPAKDTFLGATYFIIFFTVFVQGITMKPLVKLLQIRMMSNDKNYRLFIELNYGIVKNMMAGVEEIVGYKGHYYWAQFSKWTGDHFLRPAIQKGPTVKGKNLLQTYQEVDFEDKLHGMSTHTSVPQKLGMMEMECMESSNIDNENASAILDKQDDERYAAAKNRRDNLAAGTGGKRQKKPSVMLRTASDLMTLRKMIMNPAATNVDYSPFDRNLTERVDDDPLERLRAVRHTMSIRKRRYSQPKTAAELKKSHKKEKAHQKGSTTSQVLGAAMAPVSIGVTQKHPSVTSSRPPTFSLVREASREEEEEDEQYDNCSAHDDSQLATEHDRLVDRQTRTPSDNNV